MLALSGGRGWGKTSALIDRLRANPLTLLVVMDVFERDRLVVHYKLEPEHARRILVAKLRVAQGWDMTRYHLMVDNADNILSDLLAGYVDEITFSGEARSLPKPEGAI